MTSAARTGASVGLAVAGGLGLLAVLSWGGGKEEERRPAAIASTSSAPPGVEAPMGAENLRVRVLAEYPHDPEAYTQGLLWHDGFLYESTGLHGRSRLRRWRLEDGDVVEEVALPDELFGEGLALVGEELVQLTWKAGLALVWQRSGLRRVGERRYVGEGWGLCYDGADLVMSDGSDRLSFRDPATFEVRRALPVRLEGRPVYLLNELECAGGSVYANVLTDDRIVRIDPADGRVTALIDAWGLLEAEERQRAEVLNGIAYRPETGTFLITGKLWPRIFEVELVPSESPQ